MLKLSYCTLSFSFSIGKENPRFSLAQILPRTPRMQSFPFWGQWMIQGILSILAFHPLLGDQKSRFFLLSRTEWGKCLPVGRVSFFRWGIRKFSLKRWPKQFPPTPWAVFSSHKAFVKILRAWWGAFGGAKNTKKQRWLWLVGSKCVFRSQGEAWVSGTCKPSTLLCWQSKLGEYSPTQIPSLLVFLKQDIFPLVTFLVLHLAPLHHTLGEAFSIACVLLERVPSGM